MCMVSDNEIQYNVWYKKKEKKYTILSDEESDEDDEVDEEEIDDGVAGLVQQGLGGNAFRQDFVRRHFT